MNAASSEITDSHGGICAERLGGHPYSRTWHLWLTPLALMMRRDVTLLYFEGSG
jgi:hypothetical protein